MSRVVQRNLKGRPWWLGWERTRLQCQRPGFDPWVGKIPLEKEMATHSGILAWRIPWTQEPRGLQSVGSQRVGHGLATGTRSNLNLESESLALALINDLPRVSLFEPWFLDL